jgi:TetR/AcrR family transcriptional regulator
VAIHESTSSRKTRPRSRPTSNQAFNKKAQHHQKRLALVHEAARLINSRGASSLSLDEVGSSLNISKAAIYYYFKSKQELLFECYSLSFEVWESALNEGQSSGTSGRHKLEIFLHEYLNRGLSALQPVIFVREQEALEAPFRGKVEARRRALRNGIRAFVDEGVKDQSLRQVDAKIASTIIGASISWLLRTYQPGAGLDQAAFIAEAVAQLLRGLHD